MSKFSEKVIPTLDDVIQRGNLDDTPVGDLSVLEDDLEDDLDKLFINDDAEQDSKYIAEIEIDESQSETQLDFDNSITDQIVAERFSTEITTDYEAAATEHPDEAEVASPSVSDEIPTFTPADNTADTAEKKIVIGELVNEIALQLMPEIEWKVRTVVREILERHFPDSD